MVRAPAHLNREELDRRHDRCRELLARDLPEAGGLLVFSRLNIYYLSGTLGTGALWVPLGGEAVLLLRRGEERARLESPLGRIGSFRSFRDLEEAFARLGSPLTASVAAETGGLPWSLGTLLQRHLPGQRFLPGDAVLARARSVKSEGELETLREAGRRHALCLETLLPRRIAPGMTEDRIARLLWETLSDQGHAGLLRMGTFGEEVFLGHVSAGESANHPSAFNGPVGLRGHHPAVPFMGSPEVTWCPGEILVIDCGFSLDGYQTDRTQVYWAGGEEAVPREVLRAQEFCVEVQRELAERLVPGAVPAVLYSEAVEMARRAGLEDGFMGLAPNKVSFVGHGIGLAIDEFPVIARGFEEPLERGMVVALEPKVGLPGRGMAGVENTFEVTDGGGRCLTGGTGGIICIGGG